MPYKEKNGKYRASKMINGVRRTKTFKLKREAEAWQVSQTKEKWMGEQADMDSLTVLDWANGYLDHCKQRVTEKTYKDEKVSVFKRLLRSVNHELPCKMLTPSMCHKHLSGEAESRSGSAANKDRKNLAAGWNWGVKYMKLSRDNPFSVIESFPGEKRPRYVPPEEDFWKVLNVTDFKDRVFLMTMLHTAARRGELFRLKWDDIDWGRKRLQLGTKKRKDGVLEYDWLPMTREVSRLLKQVQRHDDCPFVFCTEDGHAYTSRQHMMRRLCKRAGVRHFGFHAIRHLSASMLAEEGVDIPTIQNVLRHRNALTTSRYVRQLGNTGDTLERVFGMHHR